MSKGKKSKKDRAPQQAGTTTEAPPAAASSATTQAPAATSGSGSIPVPAAPLVVLPPKVEPKFHAKPALGPDPVLERAESGFKALRENWQVLAAGALVLAVGVVFANLYAESKQARNRLAWEELRAATESPAGVDRPPSAEKLRELLDRYGGTSAEPFILIRLGDASVAAGTREGLEQAATHYQRALDAHGSNETAKFLATRSLEAARRALAFDAAKFAAEKGGKVEWAKGETATTTPETPAPTPPPSAPPSK